jgi:hypothetical protein
MLVFCSFLFVLFPFAVLKTLATERLKSSSVTPPLQAFDEWTLGHYSSTVAAIPWSSTRLSGSTPKNSAKAFLYFGKTGILPFSICDKQQDGIFTSKLSRYCETPALSRKERSFVFFMVCTSLFFLNICKTLFLQKNGRGKYSRPCTKKHEPVACSRLWIFYYFFIQLLRKNEDGVPLLISNPITVKLSQEVVAILGLAPQAV